VAGTSGWDVVDSGITPNLRLSRDHSGRSQWQPGLRRSVAAGRSRGQPLAQAEFVSNSRWHRESMLFQGGCPRAEGGEEPYAVGLVSVDRA
jgi:hypothetical protein